MSRLLTGRVSRYSMTHAVNSDTAANPMLHRHAISARPSVGRVNISRKPSRVGERCFTENRIPHARRVDAMQVRSYASQPGRGRPGRRDSLLVDFEILWVEADIVHDL